MHSDSFNLVLLWIGYLKISTSFLCNLRVADLTIYVIYPMKPPHNKQIQMNDINRKLICSRYFTKRDPCQIKNIALLRRRKFKLISFIFSMWQQCSNQQDCRFIILNWYIIKIDISLQFIRFSFLELAIKQDVGVNSKL